MLNKAWIVVTINYEWNDEGYDLNGIDEPSTVYLDKTNAKSEVDNITRKYCYEQLKVGTNELDFILRANNEQINFDKKFPDMIDDYRQVNPITEDHINWICKFCPIAKVIEVSING